MSRSARLFSRTESPNSAPPRRGRKYSSMRLASPTSSRSAHRSTGQRRRVPMARVTDLRRFTSASASSAYTAHLMNPSEEHAFFIAFSPAARLALGYRWKRADFPWLGIWQENRSRTHTPWNGATLACGMEFGASPMPESRREMIDRGRLFDTPTYRWIPAKSRVEVEYPGDHGVRPTPFPSRSRIVSARRGGPDLKGLPPSGQVSDSVSTHRLTRGYFGRRSTWTRILPAAGTFS